MTSGHDDFSDHGEARRHFSSREEDDAADMDPAEAMEMLLSRLGRTKSNAEFLSTLGHG